MAEEPTRAPLFGGFGPHSVDLAPDVEDALRALRSATQALVARVGATSTTDRLDGRQAMTVAAELASVTSRLSMARVQLLPTIEADGWWAVGGARSFPGWVATEHRVSIHEARTEVRVARTLRDHLPTTSTAAAAGEITAEHAQVIGTLAPTTDQRRELLADPDHECNEAFLVEQARTLSVDETRVLVRQWAAYADPDADDRGYVESCEREHLEIARLGDMYDVSGQLTIEHGQTLKAALVALTPAKASDDWRSPSQRRAQALADLAQIGLDHDAAGTGRRALPRISVLVDHPTMVAITEAAAARTAHAPTQGKLAEAEAEAETRTRAAAAPVRPALEAGPTPPMLTAAMLTGHAIAGGPQYEDRTPIPRALLDKLACDGELHRVLFGPQSEVLDVGRAERTFTRSRRAAIAARDKHCRYPGCTAPPALCEGHHVRQWARDHGATSVDNGILLCWYHHSLIHRRNITIHHHGRRWVFTDARGNPIAVEAGVGVSLPGARPG